MQELVTMDALRYLETGILPVFNEYYTIVALMEEVYLQEQLNETEVSQED